MAAVAVITPTYNNLPELRQCLKALSQQTYTDFVAYVCVDGSTDGTLEYLS
jgi:glycosyltransferase involved in cell wall biosynthesis